AEIQLSAEQADWRDDTNDKLEDQELEAHYLYMAKIQEVTPDVANNSGPIFDTKPLQKVQNNNDNYNVFANDREHTEQPESVNDTYQEEQGDTNITIDSLDMSTNGETVEQDDDDLAKERDLLASLIEKLKCEINDNKNRNNFLESSNKTLIDKLKGCYNDNLALMLAPKSDETIRLVHESRSKLSNLIKPFDYKNLTNLYDLFVPQREKSPKQRYFSKREYYYADHMNAILGVYTTLDEFTDLQCDYVDQVVKCERLEKELSKRTDNVNNKSFNELSKRFSELEQHSINLELALQQSQEQLNNDKVWKQKESNSFRELNVKYFEIQDLKAQLQDKDIAISELKKLIEKMKGKSVETKFEKPSVIRQPNAFKSQIISFSLNAKTSNVNFFVLLVENVYDNHDMCVLHSINGVNSRTKIPMAVPISTREPKQTVNQSVATPLKRTVASESTNQKPRSKIRKQYEQISKTCKWWYCKITPPGYKWKPKTSIVNVKPNVSMPLGNKSRTTIISEPTTLRKSTISNTPSSSNSFAARTVKFRNDQIAPILGYGDLVQRNITIKRVYYVEGLNHNLFSVGQFCDADLEVAFRKSTCYVRDLKGNDLLTATSSQAWLWHHRLSYLNFDSINLLSKNDIVIDLPKLKLFKDHLCSSYILGLAS
ncbi:retrovirus-related pol polyprotein from transposon TNT 1-94, partial [Tanacetum coccineum]